jgi:serine/threonine protein phosphatase 1
MNNVLRLKKNLIGRDIIVTDPHACFLLLKESLTKVFFNKHKDRLFIAGDLVDRGENSHVAAEWIKQDWCFSVIGNHDAPFAFSGREHLFSKNLTCFPCDPWFSKITEDEFKSFCEVFKTHLYPAIEIETDNGLVGIVHGELPIGNSWTDLVNKLNANDYDFLHDCIWNRHLAKIAQSSMDNENLEYHVPDVSHLFHGHSPSKKLDYMPYNLANRYYIDTAAHKHVKSHKYPNAGITLFDITNPNEPIYTSSHQ